MDIKKVQSQLFRWINKNKLFAILLPILLLLCGFFVVKNVEDINAKTAGPKLEKDGFNTELPGESPEIEDVEATDLWFEKKKTYTPKEKPPAEMFQGEEKDSMEAILQKLDAVTLDSKGRLSSNTGNAVSNNSRRTQTYSTPVLTEAETRKQYIEQQQAINDMLDAGLQNIPGRDRPDSLKESLSPEEALSTGGAAFRAIVFKDQHVLPNENCDLMLLDDTIIDGHLFEKNTIFTAQVDIKQNRILLDVNNINLIPVKVMVKDRKDGREGLYSKRAGELWKEFEANTQSTLARDAALELNSTGGRVARGVFNNIAAFLRSKNIKKKDKVPLKADREVLIVQL